MMEFSFQDFKITSSEKYPYLHYGFDKEIISLKSLIEIFKQ